MTAGLISATPADTSRSAGSLPSVIFKKLNRWWNGRRTNMNANPLYDKWQKLPEAAIRRWQSELLKQYLRTVVLPFSKHYRALFDECELSADSIRSLDDLARLPFTSKADLINRPEHTQRF